MKAVTIITDSTSDLSKELLEKFDIRVLPLHVSLGDMEFLDGVDITPDYLYRWSDINKATPKTSAVSISDTRTCLENVLNIAEKAIVFCISGEISSSYSVVKMVAEEMQMQDRIFVIDSRNLSTGIGQQIMEAAAMIEKGIQAEEIVKQIKEIRPYVRTSFVVDTLTYLHRGGRCSDIVALAGGVLKLHPCIFVSNGKMHVGRKYRGNIKKAIDDYIFDLETELINAKSDRIFITHSIGDDEIIETVKKQLEELHRFEEIYVTKVGSVISSHCGPGTLGISFIAS